MATASIDKKIESFISKWESHTFSNGSYPGEDYLDFQKEYRRLLQNIVGNAGSKIKTFSKNHYYFSAVLEDNETGALTHIAISDVRFFRNKWHENILYRRMSHAKDWTGGRNNYTTLGNLCNTLKAFNQVD